MVVYDLRCPLQSAAFVSTPDKPEIFAKCMNSTCYYGILRDDPGRKMIGGVALMSSVVGKFKMTLIRWWKAAVD
jgi:hypothetical protein